MGNRIFCPVCRIPFIHNQEVQSGRQVICPICAARLELIQISPEILARRYPQEPEAEIRERVDNFASMKGFVFNEDKELVLEGLLQKYHEYGDFYCPCRFENSAENVCPCEDTRKGEVRREGQCH